MLHEHLRAGFAEVDITPPTGLYMCGGLEPRTNQGVLDPLRAMSMAISGTGGDAIVIGVDLIGLPRTLVDPVIAEVARQTHVASAAILVVCSHTHNGPYPLDGVYSFGVTDADYLTALPSKLVACAVAAVQARQPATVAIGRSLVHHGQHHRRVLNKRDGKALNTWMSGALDDLDISPQILGSTGPIDPELWVLRFDDAAGKPLGLLYNLSVHANARGSLLWSADYPGVVAARVREVLGDRVVTLYTPGACADINPTQYGDDWQPLADYFAAQVLAAAQRARPMTPPVRIGAARREVAVPRRDPATQPLDAIGRLNWGGAGGRADVFAPQLAHVASMPATLTTPINALRIGPFALATNPGELFVEHGLTIKARSPFPHTAIAELTNDLILYQPTRRAFEHQGYETLVGANRVALEGIERIVDAMSELLAALWQADA